MVCYFLGFVFPLCVQPPSVSILMLSVASPSWRTCKNVEGKKKVIGLCKAKKLLCDVT